MLKHLSLTNIAIIERLEVSFGQGLTVITGESGSGKSILVDAVSLAFGAKASPKDVLRAGCSRGLVELLFDLGSAAQDPSFREFLAAHDIPLEAGETEMLISREFTPTASRSRLNGVPVARDVLENLRPWVIDLHGQHELTSLFQSERQRAYLDAFGDAAFLRLKSDVAGAFAEWSALRRRREFIQANRQALMQQRHFLAFQLDELTGADLDDPEEDTRLQQERDVLSHAEKLQRVAMQAAGMLAEGDGQWPAVLDQITQVVKRLAEGAGYDPVLQALLDQVDSARTELKAVASELSAYSERVDLRPERHDAVIDRLDALEKLKRKYGPTLSDVLRTRDRVAAELQTLETDEADLAALDAAVAEAETRLTRLSQALSEARRQLATDLTGRLMVELAALALPGVRFDVQFETMPYSETGMDAVTFLFSANPGEPLRPLAKVASGGELSRFLLALKVLMAQTDGLQALVFDEIDSGISGPTARAVGERLVRLSNRLQVLAITHQPMIAALGHDHWHVEKRIDTAPDGTETVSVEAMRLVHEQRRLNVLSRLVSGTNTTDDAVEAFVRRLLAEARSLHAMQDAIDQQAISVE